ncbi:MAG TPA: dihydrodipicolinate synthase family protein [Bryobacteraceae bacterium]|nr:dihydrodipicolinate synthase family protein [Bryobacteraceae bacterium]
MKLQGIFLPATTPFNHQGDVWPAKVEHNVSKWNRTDLAGYIVCSDTGEGALLSAQEKIRMWEWVAQYSAPEKKLIAATGMPGVRETVFLTNHSEMLGYAAAVVRAPRENAETQLVYFRAVADQSKIPVFIETGDGTSIDTVVALSAHPHIFGVIESTGDPLRIRRILVEAKPGFQIVAGNDAALAASFFQGASAAASALANAAPFAIISIWEAHRTREIEAAYDWQARIAKIADLLGARYGVPGLKHAMDWNGYYGGPPRLPLISPTQEARKEIEQALDGIKG